MQYRYVILFFLFLSGYAIKAQPPETTYLGTVVYEGYYDDRSWGPFNIGFNFTFYSNTYNRFYVTSNGLVIFGSGSNDYTEDPIPSPSTPNNFIAAFWDDIVINPSGKILYRTIGASPNRKCIIQWTNMGFYASTVLMGTFSVILYEGSNNIQIQYRSIIDNTSARSHGSSASIGIENSNGTSGIQYAYHNSSAISSEQAILFHPSGSIYTMNSSAVYDGVYLTKNLSLPEPGIAKLVSPANNSIVGSSQKFEWTSSSNANFYTLKISANSDISGSSDYNTGTNITYDITGLALNTTYYWAVFATNSTGTTWSEIYRFTTSANPPLTAVPQTIWTEQDEERVIRLQYNGGDASTKSARVITLPSQGSLYQYNAGMTGSQITSVPAPLTDPDMNLIYVADGAAGNSVGNFNFIIHDDTGDSPAATITINVNPPGIPNFLLAAKSGNIEIQFDKPMTDPTGKEAQFTVKVNGTPVTISAVSLKPGDPYTIVVSLATPLTGGETVLISYTQGDVTSESGGLLPSFVDQPVNFVIQTISFPALPEMTYGDLPVTLAATASSGLPVTFTSSNTSVATLSGNVLTANSTGTADIIAMQIGDGTYAPARYIRILTVDKADQTITFPEPGTKTYGDTDFNLVATASSGLPVIYSIDNPAVATISGIIVHITGAGTAIITASQGGNNLYYSAVDVAVTLTVNKTDQTITFGALSPLTFGHPDFDPLATSSSGLTVSYSSSNPDVAAVSGNMIHITGGGITSITASQAGDINYLAAPDVVQNLTVNRAGQTITFSMLPSVKFGDSDIDPMAVSSSGLVISYSSRNPSVAVITGNMIHITGAGSTNITASQPGDDDYLPASDVQQLLIVDKANQTISFGPLADVTYGSSDINPGATSTALLEVTYSTNNPAVASIDSGLIVINGAGNAVITASQAGNDNYYPASDVEQALAVLKAEQTIAFNPLPEVKYGDEPFSAGAIASSGLDITYSSDNLSVADITNGLIGITGAGTAIITASQPGDQNYNPASAITQMLTVIKADQVITFPPIAPVVYGVSGFNGGASSSSGLAITYSSENTLVAEVINNLIYIRGVGNSNIIARQSGDNNFNPAEDKLESLVVTKAHLTIMADNKSKAYLSANPQLTYTCSGFVYNENAIVLNVPPSLSTDAVQDSPAGDYMVTVTGGTDDCYDFSYVTGILTITKAAQTITFTAYPDKLIVNETFDLNAVATSGLPVSFESKDLQIARVTGTTLTGISRGNAEVRAFQPGNENYNAAEAEISVEVISTHENILHLFTPNSDGFNDLWEIPDLESYGKCEVRVYNRWGKLVFLSPDYHNEWDGTSNGVNLPSAAYYFIIKSETAGIISGTVNIVR